MRINRKNYKIKLFYSLTPLLLALLSFIPYNNDILIADEYSTLNDSLYDNSLGEFSVITWSDHKDVQDVRTKRTWGFIETSLANIGIESESEDIKSIIKSYN